MALPKFFVKQSVFFVVGEVQRNGILYLPYSGTIQALRVRKDIIEYLIVNEYVPLWVNEKRVRKTIQEVTAYAHSLTVMHTKPSGNKSIDGQTNWRNERGKEKVRDRHQV